MKRIILLVSLIACTNLVFSQTLDRDTYTASGGLLGGLNVGEFRIGGENENDVDYDRKLGWSLGAWFNLPIGQVFSVEPQIMYSFMDYRTLDDASIMPFGGISYFSVPILLKFDIRHDFSLTVGPQIDFFANLHDSRFDIEEDFFPSTSLGLSLGLEILPHEFISVFGRYVHGLTDFDELDLDQSAEYYNSNFQLGAKLRLFGSVIPADTDDDGIIDAEDVCPTVAGLAAFMGCPDTDSDGITDAVDECPTVAGVASYGGCPIPDADKDGVNDEVDKCPAVAGVAKYAGCPVPDSDNDGINDDNDKCPSVAGIEKYSGCPIPDTDGDGVNDEVDKCPSVAGLAAHGGCPNPDQDNDGVPDATDLCPRNPGPASNDGCPVVESATFNGRMINFVTGSAKLTANSKAALKEAAAIMLSDPFKDLLFHIHGHTDHVGSDEYNLKLSRERAASVRAELLKNGVPAARMTSEGFGESRPIATNETAEGRALNRRTEILARHNQEFNEPVKVPKQ